MAPEQIEIVFQPYGKRTMLPSGINLLDAAKALGIDLSSLCSGKGTCGKCKVKIQKGAEGLSPLTEKESKRLSKEELDTFHRLACQATITNSAVIYVPLTSRVGVQRLQTDGLEVPVKPNPFVKKYYLEMPVPSLHDMRSDEDRVFDALKDFGLTNLKFDFDTAKTLPINLRKQDCKATAVVWNDKEIIALEPGNTSERCYGLAVDIGSTKLAGFLMDLRTGQVLSVAARMNPQIPLGEDVMSRITYAMMNEWKGINELQTAVISGINEITEECCKKANVGIEEIYEMNFVGNTAMQLCFLGFWPKHVGFSPYPPVLRRGVDVRSSKLGLKAHPNSNTHFIPVIGGFVGADTIGCALGSKIIEEDEIKLVIDVGTNTEIMCGNKDLCMSDSCASGPAFEGMEIKFGMRAATGAIEKITIDPDTLELNFRTIGNAPAVGITGSALVDAPAELLKSGIINMRGNFVPEMMKRTDRLRKGPGGWEFVIARKNETSIDTDVVITLADLRALQQAKAAMHVGADILMKRMGITIDKLDKLVIAGAFGNYIDAENARTIGMYPEVPLEKIAFSGNLAGTGSRLALISKEEREKTEEISRRIKYYELAIDPEFQTEYAQSLYFPHQNLDKYPSTKELLKKLGRI